MVLPIYDLISVERQRADRLGYSGLVLTIKGYEEIFFEFGSREVRDELCEMLQRRLEHVQTSSPVKLTQTLAMAEAETLENLEVSPASSVAINTTVISDEAPPIMFRSTSSSFLDFRPKESLRITCLTIGSRGDVQPYIALCKGLIADGHHCRIASHGEYKSWVEGHGIEFAEIGGDPAELMRICVDNGMFTVAFIREGLSKASFTGHVLVSLLISSQFRGWLDDLLQSSWQACQNTDLLIESPSAMAGVHIAEAMQIPYCEFYWSCF